MSDLEIKILGYDSATSSEGIMHPELNCVLINSLLFQTSHLHKLSELV